MGANLFDPPSLHLAYSVTSPLDIDVPPIEDTDNKTLLERIRTRSYISYTGESGDVYGDSTNENETQGDYHGRFIYELLQNADDAIGNRDSATTRFELQGSTLYVANSGRPLDASDVHSLCIQGLSSKSDEEASIGRKGRGFTSVLELTDRPAVYSNEYRFQFNGEKAREALLANTPIENELSAADVPTLRLPFEPETIPKHVTRLLREETPYTTVFAFDLFDDIQDTIESRLQAIDPQTLVFLQNLNRLEISVDGAERIWTIDRPEPSTLADIPGQQITLEQYESATDTEPVQQSDYVQFHRDEIPVDQREGLPNGDWDEVTTTQVSIAFGLETTSNGVRLRPVRESPSIHVFLPTTQSSPGGFLINGAFKPESSRKRIPIADEDSGYNALLFDNVADLLATTVIEFASQTDTTVSDFLSCLRLDSDRLTADCEHYCAAAIREAMATVPFVPRVDTPDVFEHGGTRVSISQLQVPDPDQIPISLATKLTTANGPNPLPSLISSDSAYLPATSILTEQIAQALLSLDAPALNPIDIPSVLADADSKRTTVRPFSDVSTRAGVDPVVEILLDLYDALSGDTRDEFVEQVTLHDLFPVRVTPKGEIERDVPGDAALLLPPEDIKPDVAFHGVKLFAPAIYRPSGWTKPTGQSTDSDDFFNRLQNIWSLSRFNFSSFIQGVVLPHLPGGRGAPGSEADLRDKAKLSFLQELACRGSSSVADPTAPLPHEFRKATDYYRLCLLPVPTKDGGWARAYQVYFGPKWVENSEVGSAITFLRSCGITADKAPELAPPKTFVEDTPSTAEAEDSTASEATDGSVTEETRERIDEWKRFFTWLGVTAHLRLTPLWHPESDREYSATSEIGRPSAAHPTLGTGGPSDQIWGGFREQLSEAIEETAAAERNHRSIFKANRLQFWDEIMAAIEKSPTHGRSLFLHLGYWWEDIYRDAMTVGIGAHSTNASNVGGRSKGVPKPHERFQIGTNLWLWELRHTPWCPSEHGLLEPGRVWQRSPGIIERFSLTEESGEVLLPLVPADLWTAMNSVPSDFFEALEIHASVSQSTFAPPDAAVAANRIATWCERASQSKIEDAQRELRTGYRQLARVLPDAETLSDAWREASTELSDISVLCETEEGLELCTANEAYYVTTATEDKQIPLDKPPVFLLKETDAGGFGTVFGLTRFEKAVTRAVSKGTDIDNAERVRGHLADVVPSLRCVFARDRPSQTKSDARALERFKNDVRVVSSLEVTYSLDGSEKTAQPGWTLKRPAAPGESREPIVAMASSEDELFQRIAKALCDYTSYSSVSDVILLLQEFEATDRRKKLDLLDAPAEYLDSPESHVKGATVTFEESVSSSGDGLSALDISSGLGDRSGRTTSSSTDEESVDRITSPTDPVEQLIDPDGIVFDFESKFEPDSRGVAAGSTSTEKSRSSLSANGAGTSSANPSAGASRIGPDVIGSELLPRYEYDRLYTDSESSWEIDLRDCIHSVEEWKTVDTAYDFDPAAAVLEWLVSEIGLDRTYMGFDYLVLDPEFVQAWDRGENPQPGVTAIDRLIELKSLKGDGQTSLSLNEWATATESALQDVYYLYVMGNLKASDEVDEFVREIQNPAHVLETHRQKQSQTSVSITVNTKHFDVEGYVTQTPLRRKEDVADSTPRE